MTRSVVVLVACSMLMSGAPAAPRVPASWGEQSAPAAQSDGITGRWHFVFQTDGGDRESSAQFKTQGDQVTGKYADTDVKGTFKGDEMDLAFPFHSEEGSMTSTLKLKGKVKAGKINGNWQFADYEGTFVANRVD